MTLRHLDLFSGTKSWTRAFEKIGFECVSVDLDKKTSPTHIADMLTWDYTMYPPGYFHAITAGPPCTEYSRARTTGPPRNLELADRLVAKTLEIINYFRPLSWCIENPQTGLLKTRDVVAGVLYNDVSYCRYCPSDGSFPPYRKLTRIWSNFRRRLDS